jgi:hypothetical protein
VVEEEWVGIKTLKGYVVINLEYVHVKKVFKLIENGCTEPLDAELDSGERVILKTNNNIQGNLTLVNEYVCYCLCKELGIPIPDAGIGIVDENTESDVDSQIFSKDNYGCGFYSKRIDKATVLNEYIVPKIINKEEFYKIVLFDHFVYNKDRNRGNLLVSISKEVRMFAIDHSHVFKNECIWDKNCFDRGIRDCDYNDRLIIESNQLLYGYFWANLRKDKDILLGNAIEFKNKVTLNKIEGILKEIPSQWRIPDRDIISLKEYLLYRLEHLEDMCSIIVER